MASTRALLWKDQRFVALLTARTLSMLALAFAPVALAFGVLDLPGATATTLSVVLAAESIALVVFTLIGGVIADRYPRDRVLQGAEWTNALLHVALGVMFLTGHAPLWGLVTMTFLAGTAGALVWPAITGIIPQVVPAHSLQDGNALIGLGGNVARVAGLVSGGIVVVAIGGGWALVGAGAAFALAGAFITRLHLPPVIADQPAAASVLTELREGWVEFRSRTWLWVCVLQFSAFVMVWQAGHLVLGPVVAKQALGGAGAWSTILTVESFGLILGGLVAMRWRPRFPIRMVVLLSFLGAPPYLLLGLQAPLAAVAIGSFGLGFAFELLTILWQTTMQTEIPPEALSRVSSYDALGSLALGPLGIILAGPAADAFGAHHVLIVCAAVMVATSAVALSVPGIRNLRARPLAADAPLAPDSPADVGPAVSLPY
ncbi:MAG TPA: MFS transporter [Tetrasphaera sp.]|uniref:MFS transporter n=1 Tax=Nostocoides sp. TaxID=1917966 RepID=UPI002BE28A20|nr:MFS transporter [Tetrasphaera sp.]HNQ05668.1 MFS transporter [Tetrasphaera sp.]